MNSDRLDSPERRQFFKGAAVAGGAALLAATGQTEAAALPADAGVQTQADKGYRLTEHVKAYYLTLRT
ncbi:MAG: twin-arginine translocation signal domain-containing protein [Pseudomonadota bacterium]|nr:twin-arginine translocation signal domain-containing protein [Pseudomonadota bacterium]